MLRTGKKILPYLILIISTYLISELLVFLLYLVVNQKLFPWEEYQSRRISVMQSESEENDRALDGSGVTYRGADRNLALVIHPYLGYVVDPSVNKRYSDYGFPASNNTDPITSKTDQNLIVGVFGGSFAAGASSMSRDVLIQELKQLPEFRGKEIIVHTVSLAGYKQPQQLFALTYFLSLGAHFDIVINLDGFNEVTLPPLENLPKEVFPFFPRHWFASVHNFQERGILKVVGEISLLTERQKKWARLFAGTPLKYDVAGNLLWEFYNNRLAIQLTEREMSFQKYAVKGKEDTRYFVTGPSFQYEGEAAVYSDLAKMWSRSSMIMSRLCEANGIQYFHFLQPNQYVANSKVLKKEELRIAFQEDHAYRKGVVKGYPYLIREGKNLREQGVRFHDLTGIFAENDESLYIDSCCHLNKRGYDIIMMRIAESIRKEFEYHGATATSQ
jgi:hypothetical protein